MGNPGHIVIVGAGFSGAVHARTLAEAGYHVTVVDKRPHIAGNAFDSVDANGIRVHAYGPHLFHTKNTRVLDWIRRFGIFVPYTHKVRAALSDGRHVPLPVNLDTINAVHGTRFTTGAEVETYLAGISLPIPDPANAAEYLYSKIGRELTDLFFRPYTKKMWALDLEDMSAAVVRRIPLRYTQVDTYFDDDHVQVMPRDGYTAIFEKIFDHPNIQVSLDTTFDPAMAPGCTAHLQRHADRRIVRLFPRASFPTARSASTPARAPTPQARTGASPTSPTPAPSPARPSGHQLPHPRRPRNRPPHHHQGRTLRLPRQRHGALLPRQNLGRPLPGPLRTLPAIARSRMRR